MQHPLPLLTRYTSSFDEEILYRRLCIELAEQHPEDCWQRSLLTGHFTGSAWVLSPDHTKALLIHHRNLDKWVQPGGHADETDASLIDTAHREALEECGLSGLTLLSEEIFDLDIHVIPEKKGIPAHLHYDVRFLFQADNETLNGDMTEVKALRWVPLAELQGMEVQQSVRRMMVKLMIADL